ncbi:MAG: FAD-dependent oxidoreductase [Bellilinea sp.]
MTHVAILGGGIAGLSAAWFLQKAGIDFTVLEKQPYAGGLARSFKWHGFSCDFAAHRLFSSDEEVLQQLINLVPMGRHVRRSKIFLAGHWMRDPLDVLELISNLPFFRQLNLLTSYIARPRNANEDSFKNYVLRRYGEGLYQAFFKPYTEKLFGIPGHEISVLWARQKVRLANPLDKVRENTKTKFSYFYYPLREGYGAIVDQIYKDVRENVLLEAQVVDLGQQEGKITSISYIKNGEQQMLPVDYVVSTLPMSITGKLLHHELNLEYQKVDAVYLWINRKLVSDYHWIYFIDDDVCINRMVEFKNMSPIDTPEGTTVLCAEVTQNVDQPVEKAIEDLVRLKLIHQDEILDTKVIREKFSYPVYNLNYEHVLEDARKVFNAYDNLFLVGRSAEFRHREVDDNFAAAKELVGEITTRIYGMQTVPTETRLEISEKLKPRVAVVILTYNHYDDTAECLESIKALEHDGVELSVLVVDNGSADGTPGRLGTDYPFVEVIENSQNLGVPAGYNVGFTRALTTQHDYILMLNNDTIVAPDMLLELLDISNQDPNSGIVMPKMMYYGSEATWSSGGRYRKFPPAILMTDRRKGKEDITRMVEFAPSCALLIPRRTFDKVGLFDPGYFFMFDDWDFSERVRAHGLNIWYAANAHLWHKISKTTHGPQSAFYWQIFGASLIRYWRRHGRPIWISLPIHVGYVILRDFVWHRNTKYFKDFWRGVHDGLNKPLGDLPKLQKQIAHDR